MSTPVSQMSTSRLVAAYLGDMAFEFTKMRRTPAFALPTLFFPAMFYLLFGVIMGSAKGNADAALYSFAGLSVFGTMAPGLFGFGVSLAFEREYGLLTFKQALPMPPGAYLLARMAMAMIFASIISLMLILLAKFAGHVPLTWGKAASVYLVGVLGVLPFCAIGLCVGAFVSGQAAPAIVNVIYLPMAFLSGLWVPLQFLPHGVQQFAPFWPAYHLAQLSLHALDVKTMGTTLSHVAALAGVTIVFFTIAMRKLSNSGLRMFIVSKSALLGRGIFFLGVGLIVFGVMGGQTVVQPATSAPAAAATADGATVAPTSATATPAVEAPIGVPAPAVKVLGDFDAGSAAAPYGLGWNASGDADRGGSSRAMQRIVEGGVNGSKGALEVSGTIGDAIQYATAGTWFLPAGAAKGAYMDFTARKTLKFYARGDGGSYKVFVISGAHENVAPGMYDFQAGPDWKEIEVPLDVIGVQDLTRVKVIGFASFVRSGDFRFQIDDVRVE